MISVSGRAVVDYVRAEVEGLVMSQTVHVVSEPWDGSYAQLLAKKHGIILPLKSHIFIVFSYYFLVDCLREYQGVQTK